MYIMYVYSIYGLRLAKWKDWGGRDQHTHTHTHTHTGSLVAASGLGDDPGRRVRALLLHGVAVFDLAPSLLCVGHHAVVEPRESGAGRWYLGLGLGLGLGFRVRV